VIPLQRLYETILGKFSLVKPQNGSLPSSVRIILACLGHPSRALSPEGSDFGGGVAANASSVAPSCARSARTTASVPGMRRRCGASQARTRSSCRNSRRTHRHRARSSSQKVSFTYEEGSCGTVYPVVFPRQPRAWRRYTRRAWTQSVTDQGPHWGDMLFSSPSLARVPMCV